MVCALYGMNETDHGDRLKDFLEASGVSMTDVAKRITGLRVEPKGKEITKARVWNYVRGHTQMPGWFADAMESAFPGWRERTRNFASSQKEPGRNEYIENTARLAPLIPAVGDSSMKDALNLIATSGWQGKTVPVPFFLDPKYPLQFVEDDAHSPAINPGDAVQIRPNAKTLLNKLFAVTEKESGDGFYAVCRRKDDATVWERYDGSHLPLDACYIDAAVIAHLPQYTPGNGVGTINEFGLDATFQIDWPKK